MADPSEELDAIIARYLQAVELGDKLVTRERLIVENPSFAEALRIFFADQDRLLQATVQYANEKKLKSYSVKDEAPGTILDGRYKLIERIGEGGMGAVWVAEQTQPIRRKVAIKLVKAGMDTKQVLARFEAERQALALMDHPNIAKVFDGGLTDSGRPYFAMEYVKGIPFTEYCDQSKLSLKERLRLFIPICQAVQHAHHKGIVHRDLKPSNLLVCLYDGKPVPKVIDFGLAKALYQPLTDKSIYTSHGMMVGTPLYMSPEQAELNNLDVDTRSDIYSLGVVLYELLTGETPLERQRMHAAAYNEVLRLIKEVEPPRPSIKLSGSASLPSVAAQRSIDPRDLRRALAGDLDWVVMKALEKERTRRYDTANGLARDLERFLNEEAVEACPPSSIYRFKKVLKKHRGKVFAAGFVGLSLVIGMSGSLWGLIAAKQAEHASRQSEEKVTRALEELRVERDEKESQRAQAIRTAQELEDSNYHLGLQSAYSDIQVGELGAALTTLSSLPEKHRGWEWSWLVSEADKSLSHQALPANQRILALSRDGLHCILDDSDSRRLTVYESLTGKVVATIQLPELEQVLSVAVARNASRCFISIADVTSREDGLASSILVWDRTQNRIIKKVSVDAGEDGFVFTERGLQCSDDGIVFLSNAGSDNFHSWTSCGLYRTDTDQRWHLKTPRWELSPDGLTVYEIGGSGRLLGYSAESGYSSKGSVSAIDELAFDSSNYGATYAIRDNAWQRIGSETASSEPIYFSQSHTSDKAEIYDDGECVVRINGAQLQYLRTNDDTRVYSHGILSQSIRNLNGRPLHVDPVNRQVIVVDRNSVYAYPLPTPDELDRLLQLQSTGKFDFKDNQLSIALEEGDFSRTRMMFRDIRYTDHADYSPAITIRDARTMELKSIVPEGRIRFKHKEGVIAQLDDSEQTIEVFDLNGSNPETPKLSKKLLDVLPFRYFTHNDKRRYPSALCIDRDSSKAIFVMNPEMSAELFNLESNEKIWDSGLSGYRTQLLLLSGNTIILESGRKLLRVNTEDYKYSGDLLISTSSLSPNGSCIAVCGDNRLQVISANDLEVISDWQLPIADVNNLGWSSGADRLFLESDSQFAICNAITGQLLLKIPNRRLSEDGKDFLATEAPTNDFGLFAGRIVSSVPFREYWPKWTRSWEAEQSAGAPAKCRKLLFEILSSDDCEADNKFHLKEVLDRKLLHSHELSLSQKHGCLELLGRLLRQIDELGEGELTPLAEADIPASLAEHGDLDENLAVDIGERMILTLLARRRIACSEEWNAKAWAIVKNADRTSEEYTRALDLASKAVERESSSATWNTLAAARFRCKQFEDTLKAVEESRRAPMVYPEHQDMPSNDLFCAMATYMLGEHAKASELLQAAEDKYADVELEEEDQRFLGEARTLIRNRAP